jgi:hypothetical protein
MAEPQDTMIAAAVDDSLALQAAAMAAGMRLSDDEAMRGAIALEAIVAAAP